MTADLRDEGFETAFGGRTAGMVVLGERRLDRELEADEQGQCLEDHMAVALYAGDSSSQPVEPEGEALFRKGAKLIGMA